MFAMFGHLCAHPRQAVQERDVAALNDLAKPKRMGTKKPRDPRSSRLHVVRARHGYLRDFNSQTGLIEGGGDAMREHGGRS
jgi:hypothetical protein